MRSGYAVPLHELEEMVYVLGSTSVVFNDDEEPTCAIKTILQRVWRSTKPGGW